MELKKLKKSYKRKDVRLFLFALVLVFICEFLIMSVFTFLPDLTIWVRTFSDSILLFIFCFPILYFFAFRPYRNSLYDIEAISNRRLKELETNEAIVNATTDLVFAVDINGNLLSANKSFLNFGNDGKSIQSMQYGENIIDHLHLSPELKAIWQDSFDRALKGESFIFENNSYQKDRWVETTFHPIKHGEEIIGVAVHSRNITERKKTEEILKRSELRYKNDFMFQRSLLESSLGIVVFALDKNYCYTTFTKNHQEVIKNIWGVDIEIGMNMLDIISNEDDRKKAKNNFDAALKGAYFIVTEEYGDESLNRNFYENYYNPIKDADEDIVGVSVFVIDISTRKNAEITLEENLKILSTAQNVAHIGSYVNDIKSGKFKSNQIFDDIIGIDAGFIKTSENFRNKIISPDFINGLRPIMETAAITKTKYNAKYKIVRFNDKEERWVNVSGKFVYDENDRPVQFIAAMQDITEFENLLKKHEIILESISDYFYSLDKNLNIVYCNDALTDVYKHREGEKSFINKGIFELLPEYKNTVFEENLLTAIKTNTAQHFEIYNAKTNNWFEHYFYPHENGCSVMFRFINDKVLAKEKLLKANQQLRTRTEELSNSNTELERFAYVASHDLQEPLRMVKNFLQLLERNYKNAVDAKGKQYIHYAVDGAERMQGLIRDLLQYSRVGSGTLEISEVDMNEVMSDVIQLFKNDFSNDSAKIIIDKLPVIHAGKSPMTQLMQNLIENALKYRNNDLAIIHISSEDTENEWIFSVQDNGIGIEPQYFEKIFVIFQRLHNKDEYSGTGIGLSISKKIVERYKGKIWVESALNKGSTFKFSISKK